MNSFNSSVELNRASADVSAKRLTGSVPAQELREVLELRPYKLAAYLDRESRQPHGGRVVEVIDSLAHMSPLRAAMAFADLCGQRLYQESMYTDVERPAEELKQILERCKAFDAIREAMRTLPTLDALECRKRVFGFQGFEAVDSTAVALYAVMEPSWIPVHLKDMGRHFTSTNGLNEAQVHARYLEMARKSCLPITAHPNLSAANQAILDEFNDVVSPRLFPISRYGYSAVADVLEASPGYHEVWRVKNPWGDSPDSPAALSHQCADSAPAARSYFASKGIPADVFVMVLGEVVHNVCVAYFQETVGEGTKTVPVLVDASPFGGFYDVEGVLRPYYNRFNNALGIGGVTRQRSRGLAFVSGDLLNVDDAGLLPWCCEELPSGRGRVVGFGGVEARQKNGSWLNERGTPEYHGNGVRTPHVSMHFSIMPTASSCLAGTEKPSFISLDVRLKKKRVVVVRAADQADRELIEEVRSLAEKYMPGVKKFVARSGYDLSERTFSLKHR